ncbi:hypothetical protein D3C78_1348710 [compost metagenome]
MRLDFDRVFALAEILAFQFLYRLVQQALIKDARLGQAVVLQCLDQLVLAKFLGAIDLQLRDHRALADRQDQHIALSLDAHVVEEAGGEQCLDGIGGLLLGEGIPHLERKVAEHGTGLGTLQTFNANILDHKTVGSPGRRQESGGKRRHKKAFVHGFYNPSRQKAGRSH